MNGPIQLWRSLLAAAAGVQKFVTATALTVEPQFGLRLSFGKTVLLFSILG